MPLPEKVIIDTSAFYALMSAKDAFHSRAADTYEQLIDREQELWTTSYVLVETMALVHRRLGFGIFAEFVKGIDGTVRVFWVESAVHKQALSQLTASQGAGLSFVDWTVELVSQILNAHIFTFDRGFAERSLPVIPR